MQAFIPPVPLLCTSQSTQQNQCQRPQTSFTSFKHHLPYHLAVTTCQTIRAQETLFLSDDNVNKALEEVRVKLGSVFGNSADNRAVGITGEVELVELDGPVVVLRLRGRFWHKRADVILTVVSLDLVTPLLKLARVSAYLTSRIPEICDVSIEDVQQLRDTEEETMRLLNE